MKKLCTITILPIDKQLQAYEGDSLYTLLLVEGLIMPDDPNGAKLRLEKGSLSPAEHPEAEEAAFSPSEQAEDWILASERYITGDAVLSMGVPQKLDLGDQQPLTDHGYALAVDLGTGTIVAGLSNMENLHLPLMTRIANSQAAVALEADDRLAYCRAGAEELAQMQQLIRRDLGYATAKLCRREGIRSAWINTAVIVGNYYQVAILLGQVSKDAAPPLGKVIRYTAGELKLEKLTPETQLFLLPAASPELGGDTSAAVLAANLLGRINDQRISLLVDLGMRGEIVAAGRGKLLGTTVPALPFEGSGLSCGMAARTGAITAVSLEDERVILSTVRDARPLGICAAGMISAVDALIKRGMLDSEGRLIQPEDLPESLAERFRGTMSGREFVLSYGDSKFPRDICINQEDINQIQLAKGAVFAACQALMAALQADVDEISEIFLADASAATLRPDIALDLGLLPPVDPAQVINIGNAAWQGAYLSLSNASYLEQSERVATLLEGLDLTSDLIYAEEFIKAMNFPARQ